MRNWLLLDLGLMDYRKAWALQLHLLKARVENVLDKDIVLFVEHPAVFTLGRRGGFENLRVSEAFLQHHGIEVARVERGGDITYHGPGQLVAYPIVHLRTMGFGVLDFVEGLEKSMICTTAQWGIPAERNSRNRGAWVGSNKIGSVGIAVRRSISFHGSALNVNTDLDPFTWMHPCGLRDVGMTSMRQELGREIPMGEVKEIARQCMEDAFSVSFLSTSMKEIEAVLGARP